MSRSSAHAPPCRSSSSFGRFIRRGLIEPLKDPTGKQKEAYGRFLHALSAACFIGAPTLIFSDGSYDGLLRFFGLMCLGTVILLFAAPLAKG